MINLTVKTLDSQNHAFSLDDEITVRQFKEHIADTVNIAADLQRLIYCGRVLQDEKLLNVYDVNGKVIHLVQRAPPSSTQRSHNNSQSQGQGHGGTSEWQSTPRVLYRHTQLHDDPMFVGSFSIPADVVEGYEWPAPQSSNTLANTHLTVVRRMLDQANNVIDRMDNPSATDAGSTSTENTPSATQSNRTQMPTVDDSESGNTWAASISIGAINVVPASRMSDIIDAISRTESSSVNIEPQQQQEQQQEQQQSDDTTPPSSAATSTPASSQANDTLVPHELAELLEMLLTTQDRLRPYIRNRLLSNGTSESRQSNNDENQRIIDGVTECFHFLSHAQHALSNLNINMQQPPPRTLRCRPMIMQPSAILQAGLPIQVEAHISVHGQNESNLDGDDSGISTSRPSAGSTPTTTSSNNETPTTTGTNSQSSCQQPQQAPPESPQPAPQQQQSQSQSQSQTPFGTVFNLPNSINVVMEAGQPPRAWCFPTTDSQGSSNNNNNNNVTNNNNGNPTQNQNSGATSGGGGGGGGGGGIPWTTTQSPDLIRNLMQAVAGYMAQTGVAHGTIPAATLAAAANESSNSTPRGRRRRRTARNGESGASSGQDSQTRANTETHPTTSTQTRTTSRTHVFQHGQPLGVGVGLAHSLDFDPLLPCNLHHIRRGASSTSSTSATSAATTAAATNITTSTQTGGQNVSTGIYTSTQTFPVASSACPHAAADEDSIATNANDNAEIASDIIPFAEHLANIMRVNSEHENDVPLSEALVIRGTRLVTPFDPDTDGIFRFIFFALAPIPVHSWVSLIGGDPAPLNDQRVISRLRDHMDVYIRNECRHLPYRYGVARVLRRELRSPLEYTFEGESTNEQNGRAIDLCATLDSMLRTFFINLDRAIHNRGMVGENIVRIIQDFGKDLTNVLRYSLPDGQSRLETLIARFATRMSHGIHEVLRCWILGPVVDWFCNYTRNVESIEESRISKFIEYKTDMSEVATTSSETEQTETEIVAEPMEIDAESNAHPPTHNSWTYEEDIPAATFPGHENLLPDWIPIVARDGVTQRRQLSLSDDDATTMSDAYLATMPSKRRKLVEQRKAPLLVSPTSNRSAIPSSMECLIRENVRRAGFEEVDGAVTAIIADPTVRRAFGQAIRESLNPRRYQTPDFPDALRFPNATKFFTNPNQPAKQ